MSRRICVYCSSSDRVARHYLDAASALGRQIADHGDTLIYGGANCGSMGSLSRAVLDAGGHVYGVVPENLHALGVSEMGVAEFEVVPDLRVRKARMAARADAFVVLPGGIGTLDEFFETLSIKYFDKHHKPLILVNHHGFFDSLLDLLEDFYAAEFAPERTRTVYQVVNGVEAVYPALLAAMDGRHP